MLFALCDRVAKRIERGLVTKSVDLVSIDERKLLTFLYYGEEI